MSVLTNTLLNTLGGPLQISGVLCAALSSLILCLANLLCPESPYTQLCLLNVGHSLGCAWKPLLYAMTWKFSQGSKSGLTGLT